MKNKVASLVLIAAVALLILCIIVIISSLKDNDTPSYDVTLAQDTPAGNSYVYTDENAGYISESHVTGYMMKSENYAINIYEIYSNGHYRIIDTISVNPSTLPQTDRLSLAGGIVTDSYSKICSLIEDYSS